MESNKWKKIENEAGYPCYIEETTGKQQYDHPEFLKIVESLKVYDGIKYSAYRVAFKIYALQKQLKVPALRISSGVFARHQLSLSESSLSLDTVELEAVLADIYFAAEKEGQFSGDVDLAVDLMINLLLNVHDKDRKEPVRVLAAKTLLIILSEESATEKWAALANCSADHNGCVSPKRLASLLTHVTALSAYLGSTGMQVQDDVDACFEKNAGMLGLTSRAVAEWAANCASTRWLPVVQRVTASRQGTTAAVTCAQCTKPLVQMLKFQCTKCSDVIFCEKCYLYDKDITVCGHKESHLVQEAIDGQIKPPQCLSFIKGMKRFFFCTKTKTRKTVNDKQCKELPSCRLTSGRRRRKKDGKPAIFTSTVGKASGTRESNHATMLQDIITQLETQNKALQDLATRLKETASHDENLKAKVDAHWSHISTQINRLKALKDNLSSQAELPTESTKADKTERPQAFDLFSPILKDDTRSKVTDSLKNQPRILSLDSGNFSVVSKNASQNLLTMSGDALRPVVLHTSDSISTVSMNDISSWYNESESLAPDKRRQLSLKPEKLQSQEKPATPARPTGSIAACEADIRSVEHSNVKMKELNADLDTVLDRLHQILANNFAMDDSRFDNTQLRETANEMEGLLGTLIRGVEQRATLNASRGLV